MKHEGDSDTNGSWGTWNGPQKFWKKTRGTENQRKNRDHPNHVIVEIGCDTEKSPGDLRRRSVTQTPRWCGKFINIEIITRDLKQKPKEKLLVGLGGLISLQRGNRCILQSQQTELGYA